MNVEKYPPSTQYLLVTLGTLFLVMAALEILEQSRPGALRRLRPLLVFGTVSFFFYVLHLYLIRWKAA